MKTKVTAAAIAAAAFLMLAGCSASAQVGVGKRIELPKDSAAKCTSLCEQIGLGLDSVVVMASNVGCVCRAAPAPGTTPPAASAGGMAAILIQEAEAAAAAQRQRSQQSQPPRPPPTR